MITDPIRACEALLGQTIKGISVNEEEQEIVITCSNGVITFYVDDGDVTLQVEETQ